MTRSHLWGVATILANTFFRECTPLRLLRYARNDMSLIRKIRYQLAWDTTQKWDFGVFG